MSRANLSKVEDPRVFGTALLWYPATVYCNQIPPLVSCGAAVLLGLLLGALASKTKPFRDRPRVGLRGQLIWSGLWLILLALFLLALDHPYRVFDYSAILFSVGASVVDVLAEVTAKHRSHSAAS